MKCPKCEQEIKHLFFLGDGYYGDYDVEGVHEFALECPNCSGEIFFIYFDIEHSKANIKILIPRKEDSEKL